MKKIIKMLLTVVVIMGIAGACGKQKTIDQALLKPLVGEWQCAESPLEHEDYYTGFLTLKIQEDASFNMYDAEAGNPGISGELGGLSDTELILNCNTEDDFDPPPSWEDMSEKQTITYKFISEQELHLSFENEGNVSTLVFRMDGAEDITKTYVFMKDKIQEGDLLNLFYVPNAEVEKMSNSEVYLMNNGLLLTEVIMDEEYSDMVLKLISLEDGSLLAENRLPVSGDAMIQFGQGCFALQDCSMGSIQLLNEELKVFNGWELDQMYDKWYLSQDLETVYMFSYDGTIIAKNLIEGEERTLLNDITDIQMIECQNYSVYFSHLDQNGEEKYKVLDLADGSVRDIRGYDLQGLRHLGTKLLKANEEGSEFDLYGLNGEHISHCVLSDATTHLVSNNFVWSGYWQGYYFTDTTETGSRLMFWDPSVPTEGEDLSINLEEIENEPVLTMAELKEKAGKISAEYGVDIRVGDDCALNYVGYSAPVLEDERTIEDALNVLETCLGNYPEGFMEQLLFGSIESVRIELVGRLKLNEGVDAIDASGFVEEREDYIVVVLDGNLLFETPVYHELTHVIDKRLEWDMNTKQNALFSESAWLKLQPKGFDYAYSYTSIPKSVEQFYGSDYFVSEYSCTFPEEDRATMMEAVMSGQEEYFEGNPNLSKKLEYYSECIRDTFDTTGWPQETSWEILFK